MIQFWSEQEFVFEQNKRTDRVSTHFNHTQYMKVLIAKKVVEINP